LAALSIVVSALFLKWIGAQFETPAVLLGTVVLSAFFGGRGPGLLATVLATAALYAFFTPHLGYAPLSLWIVVVPRALFSFVVAALIVTFLSAAQRRATREIRASHTELDRKVRELERVNRTLEGEIADRKRAESLLAGERRILELVAKGETLPRILDNLCQLVEEQTSGVLASVLLLEDGRLKHGGAPSLPRPYIEAIDGISIGPTVGSCGTAAFLGKQVIVSDISTDPLWANYRDAALPHSLRACWSTPIVSSEGAVIGTFAMYYREPRSPGPRDQDIIEQITHLAGVAIQSKLNQEALRASEEQWKAVFENNPTMYFMVDAAGMILSVNPFGAEQLGYRPGELVGRPVATVLHEDDRMLVEENAAACIDRLGQAMSWELRKVRKNGEVLWMRETARAVLLKGRAVVLIVCEDITERKRSEQHRAAQYAITRVLAEADNLAVAGPQLIRAICDHLEWDWAGLWTTDSRGERLSCDCICNTRGLQAAEFDSLSRKMAFAPDQGRVGRIWRSGQPDWFADVLREGAWFMRGTAAEKAGLHGSVGVPILLDTHCLGVLEFFSHAPRQRDDDELHTLSTIGSQIGQFIKRKRAEAAVLESERRWRTIFDTAGVGIATSGRNCRFTTANKRFQEMLGYTEEELRNLTPFDIAYEDDRAAAEPIRSEFDMLAGRSKDSDAMISDGPTFRQVETRCRRKDGSLIWVNVITSVMPESNDDRFSLAAMIVDITARKHTEGVLEQARAELRRLNRVMLLGEMTASIAHEVNQPIAAVITNANAGLRWLEAQPPDVLEIRQALARIARDGNRAAEVIDRIRSLTRKRPPHAALLDVNEIVGEVITLMHTEVQKASVECRLELHELLPPSPLDRVQVQQVFMNLILNAIEAMGRVQDRPRELDIFTGREDANHVYVEVRDTGPGFDPESADRLFHSFYTTKPESMGMGLAICRSILEAHGGSISASPNRPHGAIFRCTLPVGLGVFNDRGAQTGGSYTSV
jgi:PAS domain S-box-containing protein